MSQDQNAQVQCGPPKRFLRKGEGLKRFAAYKPPLPCKPVERRQTFVRFKLNHNSNTITREPAHFIPPEILNDDSINLSTEVPKIAPPKIIHTPIRPNRNALGTITNETSMFSDSKINGNIDNLFKRIEEKKSALQDKEEHSFFGDESISSPRRAPSITEPTKDDKKGQRATDKQETKSKRRNECLSKKLESSNEELRVTREHEEKSNCQTPRQTSPTPGSEHPELTKQLEKIESTVNELKDKLKDCQCCTVTSPQTTRRRPTTRAAARAAQSKKSDPQSTGPSAAADKLTTKEKLDSLAGQFAQLKTSLDELLSKN